MPGLLAERGITVPTVDGSGATVVAVAWDGVYRGALLVADTVKPTSARAVACPRELGLTPVLLTGDTAASAAAVAAEAGITEVLPADPTLRTIKGNLFWAFAYNVAAIPLAAAGLVTPVLAAAATAFSSVFVVTNSLRLFSFRPAA